MLDWSQCRAVERVPGKISGVWVFAGTRVPIRALFENLEGGASVEDFTWFWKWDDQTVDFKSNGEFDGNRWNDCHYTTAFKRLARDRKKK